MSSFKVKKTDPLFSTPLCLFEIENSADLNKKLISESRAWRKQEKGANVSNQGDSWHSPDGLMMRGDPGFSEISKMIPQIAAQYALQINPHLDIKISGLKPMPGSISIGKAALIPSTITAPTMCLVSIISNSQPKRPAKAG
ncbi:MAG: hypothetical protein VW456_08865 [Alphaproteobacteria bacterium]